jgi:uncharacterized OsmC-like protein
MPKLASFIVFCFGTLLVIHLACITKTQKQMKTIKNTNSKKIFTALFLILIVFNIGMATNILSGNNTTTEEKSRKGKEKKEKEKEPAKVNGFNMSDIAGTVQALQENPEIAKFEFRVKNKWIKGGHNRSQIQGFYGGGQEDVSRKKPFVYDNSEPPILLGNNEGANPVEYILHGLAGCMTTTMVLHAAANGIELKSVESSLEGDLDVQGFLGLNPEVRNGYQQIRVTFTIEGNLTEQEKQKLETFVQMSPVFDIVTNKVPVQVSLQY